MKTLEGATNITKLRFGMQSYTLNAQSTDLDLSKCTSLTHFSASYFNVRELTLPYSITYLNYTQASGNIKFNTEVDSNGITSSRLNDAYLRANYKIQSILTNMGASCLKLNTLEVFNNQGGVTDFSVLKACSSLNTLKVTGAGWTGKLNYTNISTLNGLAESSSLTKIQFSWLTINNLDCIKELTGLTQLYIDNCDLNNINGVSNLVNLTTVNINNTRITDISPLNSCINITSLTLNNNFINSGIKELSNLKKMTILNLTNNSISDRATSSDGTIYKVLEEILKLNKNGKLKTLKIAGNPGIIDYSLLGDKANWNSPDW